MIGAALAVRRYRPFMMSFLSLVSNPLLVKLIDELSGQIVFAGTTSANNGAVSVALSALDSVAVGPRENTMRGEQFLVMPLN